LEVGRGTSEHGIPLTSEHGIRRRNWGERLRQLYVVLCEM